MNRKIRVSFDTNILVYAHDESSMYHLDSADLLTLAIENKIQGVLAEQNIVELYRILTNSVAMKKQCLTPLQTTDLINNIYLNENFEIIYPTASTINKILELAVDNNITSAQIFDVRLAALCLEKNIDYLATYNTNHFERISEINSLKPPEIIKIINN
ncbi:MAG: type II toxin-antitoxin system VapC family toxin [Crocosphaera sp.]